MDLTTLPPGAKPAELTPHEIIAGGDGWLWRPGSGVVQTSDGETRLILPGSCRTPETVEAFLLGYVDGQARGRQWGSAEGAESVRAQLRQLLGVPDAHGVYGRLMALEGE